MNGLRNKTISAFSATAGVTTNSVTATNCVSLFVGPIFCCYTGQQALLYQKYQTRHFMLQAGIYIHLMRKNVGPTH